MRRSKWLSQYLAGLPDSALSCPVSPNFASVPGNPVVVSAAISSRSDATW